MELINRLQQIGLTRREAEVYIALLQRKEFTAPELAKVTTITRTKIYEILQNLIRKGVCNENLIDGLKVYRGIKPTIALQNIISNFEAEIESKKIAAIEQMKQAALFLEKDLTKLHESNRDSHHPIDYIEVISDPGQIRDKWISLQKNTTEEMLAFNKSPYSMPHEQNAPFQQEMFSRNVIGRGIYEYKDVKPGPELDEFISTVEMYVSLGEESRVIDDLPMKMIVMDSKVTMLALNDPVSMSSGVTTIVISHRSFAKAQKEVFESYWTKSISITDFKKNIKNIFP